MRRSLIAVGLTVLAALMLPDRAAAQTFGTEIIVAIAADVELYASCYFETGQWDQVVPCATEGSLYRGNVAVVTGKSEGTISGGSCALQIGDVHSVVLVDPGGQRAARRTEIVVYYAPDGVRPGDRRVRDPGGD